MRKFSHKEKKFQRIWVPTLSRFEKKTSKRSDEIHPILHLHRTIGNEASLWMQQLKNKNLVPGAMIQPTSGSTQSLSVKEQLKSMDWQKIYYQAMPKLKRYNEQIRLYLQIAGLDNGHHLVRHTAHTGSTNTYFFMLEVKIADSDETSALAKFSGGEPHQRHDVRVREVLMNITINPNKFLLEPNFSPAKQQVDLSSQLARSLFHEGIHMLLHIDKYVKLKSKFGQSFQIYLERAKDTDAYKKLLLPLRRYFGETTSGKSLTIFINNLIEEKFIDKEMARAERRVTERKYCSHSTNFDIAKHDFYTYLRGQEKERGGEVEKGLILLIEQFLTEIDEL